MNFLEAMKSFYKRYFDFKSRSSVSEYWWFTIVFIVLFLVPFLWVLIDTGGAPETMTHFQFYVMRFTSIFFVTHIVGFIALNVRRLHDITYSGWWLILIGFFIIIPYFNAIVGLVYWTILSGSGDEGENKYGYNPLTQEIDVFD